MTHNNHPITPPPELVQKLADGPGTWLEKIIKAYRAGADQELEAICEWELSEGIPSACVEKLRAARRPNPKTLKERGREALQSIHNAVVMETGGRELDVLKEIVESLPDEHESQARKTTSLMQTFDQHNQKALGMFQLNTQPHLNGISCPKCQHELMDSNPSVCLTSWPPQYSVHCPSCGYTGTRY